MTQATSAYLNRPIRTLEQAKEDIQADNAKADIAAWRRRRAEQSLKNAEIDRHA